MYKLRNISVVVANPPPANTVPIRIRTISVNVIINLNNFVLFDKHMAV